MGAHARSSSIRSSRASSASASISHARSTSGFEVDFILGDHTGVEVKAKTTVGAGDLKGLLALAEEGAMKRLVFVCLEPRPRRVGQVDIMPLAAFLQALWDDALH